MNFNDMYKDVCITLDKVVGKNEFIGCLNTIIRRLNSEAQKPVELVTITGDLDDIIADLTDAIIDMTDTIGSGERWLSGFDWDDINYAVTLPINYTKVLTVFKDDKKMQPVSYDVLQTGGYSDYYTSIGNTIYFNTDLYNSTNEIKVRAKLDYPTYVSGDNYTGFPENAYSLLLSGILFMLLSRPKYKDDLALAIQKEMFEKALYNYNIKVLEKDLKSADATQFYTY